MNINKKKELSEAIKGCTNGIVNCDTNVLDLSNGSNEMRNKEALLKIEIELKEAFDSVIDKAIKESGQFAVEVMGEYEKLSFDYKELSNQHKELVGMYKELGNRFLKENSEADNYFGMCQILIDTIVLSDIEDGVIKHIKNDMEQWEEDGDFAEHSKESYVQVIKEIQEFSDMIKNVEKQNKGEMKL
jgi:uncharacterized coiled-coil DUF342 family protein